MPIGDILVGNTTRDIKHDDGTLTLNVVPVAETTKLFLPGRIPNVEFDGATVGVEKQGMDFHTQGGHVLLFKFTSQMTFDKGGFTHPTVSDEDQLEFGGIFGLWGNTTRSNEQRVANEFRNRVGSVRCWTNVPEQRNILLSCAKSEYVCVCMEQRGSARQRRPSPKRRHGSVEEVTELWSDKHKGRSTGHKGATNKVIGRELKI